MPTELSFENFGQLAPLFERFLYDLAWLDVGLNEPGQARAFAYPANQPQLGLLCLASGESFIAGESDPRVIEELIQYVYALNDPPRMDYLGLPATSWRTALIDALPGRVEEIQRVDYSFEGKNQDWLKDWRTQIPEGYQLAGLDSSLARQVGLEVDPDFDDFWPDHEDFVKEGLGYGLLHEGRLVSVAYSALKPYRRLEIAVSTVPEYRGKGLATLACMALIEAGQSSNLEPHWTTEVGNLASRKTAQRLGFGNEELHYWLKLG